MPQTDPFASHRRGLESPAATHFEIILQDGTNLPVRPRVLRVVSAGNLAVRDAAGTVIIYPVTAGETFAFSAAGTEATGTTAPEARRAGVKLPDAGTFTYSASRPAETLAIRSSVLPATMPVAVSLALEGRMNFADTGSAAAARFFDWRADGGNHLSAGLNTAGTATGQIQVSSAHSGAASTASGAASACAPGLNVPVSFAARHPAAQLELTAKGETAAGSPAPSALPDLAAAGIGLAPAFKGSLGRFRLWDRDLGSAGIGRIPA